MALYLIYFLSIGRSLHENRRGTVQELKKDTQVLLKSMLYEYF